MLSRWTVFVTPSRLIAMTRARRQAQLRDRREFRDSLPDDPRVIAYFPFDQSNSEDRLLVGYGADGDTIEGPLLREPLKESASGLLTIGDATIGHWSVPTSRHRRSSIRNFDGCMDELIAFGQALDDQVIRRIYEVGRP